MSPNCIGIESPDFLIPYPHRLGIGPRAEWYGRRPHFVHSPRHRNARISVKSTGWNGHGYDYLRIGQGTNAVSFLQGHNVRSGLLLREQAHLVWMAVVDALELANTVAAERALLFGQVQVRKLAIHCHVGFQDQDHLLACLRDLSQLRGPRVSVHHDQGTTLYWGRKRSAIPTLKIYDKWLQAAGRAQEDRLLRAVGYTLRLETTLPAAFFRGHSQLSMADLSPTWCARLLATELAKLRPYKRRTKRLPLTMADRMAIRHIASPVARGHAIDWLLAHRDLRQTRSHHFGYYRRLLLERHHLDLCATRDGRPWWELVVDRHGGHLLTLR